MVMTSYPIIYLDFAANLFSNLGNHTSVFIRAAGRANTEHFFRLGPVKTLGKVIQSEQNDRNDSTASAGML